MDKYRDLYQQIAELKDQTEKLLDDKLQTKETLERKKEAASLGVCYIKKRKEYKKEVDYVLDNYKELINKEYKKLFIGTPVISIIFYLIGLIVNLLWFLVTKNFNISELLYMIPGSLAMGALITGFACHDRIKHLKHIYKENHAHHILIPTQIAELELQISKHKEKEKALEEEILKVDAEIEEFDKDILKYSEALAYIIERLPVIEKSCKTEEIVNIVYEHDKKIEDVMKLVREKKGESNN